MKENKKYGGFIFVAFLFCFGLCYYCFRILGFDLSRTPGDYGDSRFINYILEHGFKWLKGEDPDFWRANFMYPFKNNVAISDCMAGALPLYAPFRFLGIDVETSFQLWWLSCCVLNFWCCFYALKKLDFNPYLGAIGAYVFAFGITTFNQFPHLQFNCKFFIPLAFAALYQFLRTPLTRHFIFFSVSVVLQFYASAYLGLILIYFSLFFSLFYFFSRSNRRSFVGALYRKTVMQCSAVVVVSVLLLLVVAIPYHNMAESGIGYRDYTIETQSTLPRLNSYFFPNSSSLTWDVLKNHAFMERTPNWYLHDLFPGLFCYLGLALAFIYFIKSAVLRHRIGALPLVLFGVVLFFVLVSSRTESGFSLFYYFRQLPGLSSMRLTQRFMIINVFLLVWLTLYFLNRLSFKGIWLYGFLAVIVIGDNLFTPDPALLSISPKKEREARVANMRERIVKSNPLHKKIVACINVTDEADAFMQTDVMLATQQLGLSTLNGYSSTCIGELCGAYTDSTCVKLERWMQQYGIDEKDVIFITN